MSSVLLIPTNSTKEIVVYTDGACLENPGSGGWGCVVFPEGDFDAARVEIAGGEQDSTNNRMELTAVISALRFVKTEAKIKIFSDSEYVVKGMNEWRSNWKKRGWKKSSSSQPVMNSDLWQALDALDQQREASYHWVKAHAGDTWNERADQLASEQAHKIDQAACNKN